MWTPRQPPAAMELLRRLGLGGRTNDDHDDRTGSGEERFFSAWHRREGATVLVKKLHRKQMLPFFSKLPPCLISMEACGTAHHWARTLSAMGHDVRLIPPSYVKAFVKRGKSDAIDAAAVCEAVQRRTMQFVPVKTFDQQSILMAHRARALLVRQRTQTANALRSHLAELGLVAHPGVVHLAKLAEQALADKEALPSFARAALEILLRQIVALGGRSLNSTGRSLPGMRRAKRAAGSPRYPAWVSSPPPQSLPP